MALEMKSSSKWWYARLSVGGKLRRFPLMEPGGKKKIEIKGKRPASIKKPEEGDRAFLASYHRAKAAHDLLSNEQLEQRNGEDCMQRLLEAKTGTRFDFVKVAALPEAWAALPRKRQPGDQHASMTMSRLRRFANFIRLNFPGVEDLDSVRADHVRAFLAAEDRKGISGRTWNISLKLLKGGVSATRAKR